MNWGYMRFLGGALTPKTSQSIPFVSHTSFRIKEFCIGHHDDRVVLNVSTQIWYSKEANSPVFILGIVLCTLLRVVSTLITLRMEPIQNRESCLIQFYSIERNSCCCSIHLLVLTPHLLKALVVILHPMCSFHMRMLYHVEE